MPTAQDHKKKNPTPPAGFRLKKTGTGLSLVDEDDGLELKIDFSSGEFVRRVKKSWRGEALLRAVGRKAAKAPTVLDATGGIGRDAFILASHGCRVIICEKVPILAAMLKDALARVNSDTITLYRGDSIALMRTIPPESRPDVIYLDPMYPERKKKALVKKEMRILQKLCGHEDRGGELLAAARSCADNRVVVKRPGGAPPLPGPAPSFSIKGPAQRFDIYLLRSQAEGD